MGRTVRGEGKRRNKPKRCPVHKVALVGKITKWGMQFCCPEQDCTVIQWQGSTSTPADYPTRQARRAAHFNYDKLWRGGGLNRSLCYKLLARFMDLRRDDAHIGMFSREQCQKVHEFTAFIRLLMEQCRQEKAATGITVDIRSRVDRAIEDYKNGNDSQCWNRTATRLEDVRPARPDDGDPEVS